jgi:hypothetical protein
MKKLTLLYLILMALIMGGCLKSSDKTVVTISLSDSDYLYAKYPGWFDAGETLSKETIPDNIRQSLAGELEEEKEKALLVIAKRIESAAEPLPALAGLLNKLVITTEALPEENSWSFTINRNIDPDQIKKLLETKTDCGFWETYKIAEVWDKFARANELIKEYSLEQAFGIEPDTSEFGSENPLFRILRPMTHGDGEFVDGCQIGVVNRSDTATVTRYLSAREVMYAIPPDMKLMWSTNPIYGNEEYYSLIALKMSSSNGEPLLTEESIVEASVDEKIYPPTVNIRMNSEGAHIWARVTADNIGRNIAFVMNGSVLFHPRVNMEIKGGASSISGDFTLEEAKELAIILGSGYLPEFGIRVITIN